MARSSSLQASRSGSVSLPAFEGEGTGGDRCVLATLPELHGCQPPAYMTHRIGSSSLQASRSGILSLPTPEGDDAWGDTVLVQSFASISAGACMRGLDTLWATANQ